MREQHCAKRRGLVAVEALALVDAHRDRAVVVAVVLPRPRNNFLQVPGEAHRECARNNLRGKNTTR